MTTTTEIPAKSWESFCSTIKDSYRGVISIRWIQPGGDIRMVADGLPLHSLVFRKQDRQCNDMMIVEAGVPNERQTKHQIVEPFRLVLRKNEESGRYNELEILSETGKTEIMFTPGIEASFLEKLTA